MSRRHDPIAAQRVAATPHAPEHRASVARQMRQPRHFREYLAWFLEGYDAETPDALHAAGVWHGNQQRDRNTHEKIWPSELVGGSAIGSPSLDDGFRRLLENSPRETDRDDEAYVRPMRAALTELGHSAPLFARTLTQYANGMSAEEVVARYVKDAPQQSAEIILCHLLERLYRVYRPDPPPRTIRDEGREIAS